MRSIASICLALAVSALPASAQEASVLYEIIFDATWSAETHPTAVPPDPHFSRPVAASHDASIAFWQAGGLASQGIEDMAELGATSPLTLEMAAAVEAGSAFDYGATDEHGLFVEFAQSHPLATFVSMVAPSPDWFVGVSGVPLFANGAWQDEVSIPLYPWDAGTDLGSDFLSPDFDQQPQGAIALLGAPFTGTPALGVVTFRRVANGPCHDGVDQDGDGLADFPSDPGCDSPVDADETSPALVCDDGLDNDGDGYVDEGADPGCQTPISARENPQCQDGIDNDLASGIDFDGGASLNGGVALAPRDPQCTAAWRNLEAAPPPPPACGIGAELALALPALLALRARGRRRAA